MNGYTKLHPVEIVAEAQMLESVAGYTEADVLRELFSAANALDANDEDTLRWMACLCARRIDDMEASAVA